MLSSEIFILQSILSLSSLALLQSLSQWEFLCVRLSHAIAVNKTQLYEMKPHIPIPTGIKQSQKCQWIVEIPCEVPRWYDLSGKCIVLCSPHWNNQNIAENPGNSSVEPLYSELYSGALLKHVWGNGAVIWHSDILANFFLIFSITAFIVEKF